MNNKNNQAVRVIALILAGALIVGALGALVYAFMAV